MEIETHRVPGGTCPIEGCHRQLDAASGGTSAPAPGDVTVCAYCNNWLVFTDDLCLREITEEEIDDLDQEEFQLLARMSRVAAGIRMRRKT